MVYTEKEFIDKIIKEFEEHPDLYMACYSETESTILQGADIDKLKQIGMENGIYVKRLNETKTKKKTYTKEYEKHKTIGFSKYDF